MTLLEVLLQFNASPYQIESWVLLGLAAVFLILYGIKIFKKTPQAYIDAPNKKRFLSRGTNEQEEKVVTSSSDEVKIEDAHTWTERKPSELNISATKIHGKVDTKEDLKKLKEIRG